MKTNNFARLPHLSHPNSSCFQETLNLHHRRFHIMCIRSCCCEVFVCLFSLLVDIFLSCIIATWAKTSLSGTTRNNLKEWLRNQNRPNHSPRPITLNVLTTIIFFPHVYQLHALIYGLKFILELKNWKLLKVYIPN